MMDRESAEHSPEFSDNPYLAVERKYLDRLGSSHQRERMWMFAAFLASAVAVSLSALLFQESGQSRVVPFVVEVDKLGRAVAVSTLPQTTLADDRIVKYMLAEWIRHTRSVLADPILERKWMLSVHTHTAGAGREFIDRYFHQKKYNPLVVGQKTLVDVEIDHLLKKSDRTWYAEWTETSWGLDGKKGETHKWQGFFTVEIVPPTRASEIRENPLGQYLTFISWNRMD